MEVFKGYLASEYDNKNCSAIDWKFTHSISCKLDKKSKVCLNQHIINISMAFYDKDMKLLCKAVVKFVNNELPKQIADKLVKISPAELTNKFMFAKKEIINQINNDYKSKLNKIKTKIDELNKYCEKESIATSSEFKGELTQISDSVVTKKAFDM